MSLWYKLNDDKTVEPLPAGTYPQKDDNFRVGDDTIDGQRVSTVFLSMDHNMSIDAIPVLFETMIFDGPYDGAMWRYSTWDEAKTGHDYIVNCLKQGIKPEL